MQLFANLIENAFKHAGGQAAVDCSIRVESDTVVVIVNDNGPGIPDDQRDRVLRRLYRLEESRTTPGFGLGLTMAKAIADLHGARMELGDNKPGLRIRIAFPVAGSAPRR